MFWVQGKNETLLCAPYRADSCGISWCFLTFVTRYIDLIGTSYIAYKQVFCQKIESLHIGPLN